MKWHANDVDRKQLRYEIEYIPAQGFYFYVFEESQCIYDFLQETLELAKNFALENFSIPKTSWKRIIESSISLNSYGLDDLAWHREDAKNLIISILKEKIAILGGDVYKLTSHRLEPLYDNWSCEPNEGESEEEYYQRSKAEALTYIENYPIQVGKNIVFSMTFNEKI